MIANRNRPSNQRQRDHSIKNDTQEPTVVFFGSTPQCTENASLPIVQVTSIQSDSKLRTQDKEIGYATLTFSPLL